MSGCWPKKCSAAFRRWSCCASAIPAPRPTCWRSPPRARRPASPAVMIFDGAYHGSILYFSHGGSPLNMKFEWITSTFNDLEQGQGRHRGERLEAGRRDRRADAGRRRRAAGRARLPQGPARGLRRAQGAAGDRRGHDLAHRSRRRAAHHGREAGPDDARQVCRRRPHHRRVRRPRRHHGALRSQPAGCLSAWRHLQQQRAGDGGRPCRADQRADRRHAGAHERAGRHAARAAERSGAASTRCR